MHANVAHPSRALGSGNSAVDCPAITDEICDYPCSLFVEHPTPGARTYANQPGEDSREVALIAEAARQGHIR